MLRQVPVFALILTLLFQLQGCSRTSGLPADLLLLGGALVDGSGAPPRRADVAVREGRIIAIGDLGTLPARRVLEVAGLIIAPGFVDIHSHADLILLGDRSTQERLLAAKIRQGVTSLIVGNCGLGVAPATEEATEILSGVNGWMTPEGVAPQALTIGNYLDRLEVRGIVLNVGTLIPHGPLRISAMGLSSGAPSPQQLRLMRQAVAQGLKAGAFGFSTGLIYPPGMYADTDELVRLAQEVGERDRLFTAHIRGSSETLLAATKELIEDRPPKRRACPSLAPGGRGRAVLAPGGEGSGAGGFGASRRAADHSRRVPLHPRRHHDVRHLPALVPGGGYLFPPETAAGSGHSHQDPKGGREEGA